MKTFYCKNYFQWQALCLIFPEYCVFKPCKIGGTPEFGVLVGSVKKSGSWIVGLIFRQELMVRHTKSLLKICSPFGWTHPWKIDKILFWKVRYLGSLLGLAAPLGNRIYVDLKLLNHTFRGYLCNFSMTTWTRSMHKRSQKSWFVALITPHPVG